MVVATVVLTAGLFLLACGLPAVDTHCFTDGGALQDTPSEPFVDPGWLDLALGWVLCWFFLCPAWLANPLLGIGVGLLIAGSRRWATGMGVVAAALGLSTFIWLEYADLYPGYYVWQASHLVFAAGGFCACLAGGEARRPWCAPRPRVVGVLRGSFPPGRNNAFNRPFRPIS
jgi:hypothetical protein